MQSGSKIFKRKIHLVFLRDNTKVYKDWLTYTLKLIESDKEIGLVGSKIINVDGILEDAGGIVWKDGEFTNYGAGKDAENPEFNYVKNVDFVSSVSLIVKKSLWNKLGGFDIKFIPINYADIDFSFKIWKCGYKVMYQPKSVVEYNNNISNQTKKITTIQNYGKQLIYEKWKNVLNYQMEKGNYFISRDRGFNKSRVFVIDGFVPKFDKDAGGRCSFMYLNIFKEIGLEVTFLASNLIKEEPYTSILQQKGIEVLYGKSFKKKKMKKWIKNNLKHFKYIYLQRPDVTINYIDIIKKYFSGKIIYFAHDLHYIRLFRQYNITHNKKKYIQSKKMKKIEMEIFSKVDVIYVVGNYEYNILKEKYINKTIRNIPLYIYENQYKNIDKNFSKRNGLIFVGMIRAPNIDAIRWFKKEIYPKIISKFPEIVWYIVVSNNPKYIKKMESKNIKIIGHLSDEELHSLYQKCRLAIAPLRFGAGVKGKVIEAAYNQIPMVTTSIGAEGINKSTGAFIIADSSEKMIETICNLYLDYPKLKQMSDSGRMLIEKFYSKKIAKEIILKDFM